MSADDKGVSISGEKKIRFRAAAKVLFSPENKIEDLFENDKPDGPAEPHKRG